MPDLRTLRRRQGLTILEVARRGGLGARAVAELEYGLRPLDDAERAGLARAYNLAPQDLEAALPVPAPLARARPARGRSRRVIFSRLLVALIAALLFGGAVAWAQAHEARAAARLAGPGQNQGWSANSRQLPTAAPRASLEPALRTPQHGGAPALAVAAPPLPTATIASRPSDTATPLSSADSPTSPPTDVPSPSPNDAPSAAPEAADASAGALPQSSVAMPLPADGPFHTNVVAALEANNGALQHVVIPPNGVWSFNRAVGNPDLLRLEPIAGIYGGGWCDLASRYTMVLRPLLPREAFEFIRHVDSTGFGLQGVPDDDGVVIWNSNGADGEQDLRIHNTSGRTIRVDVTLAAEGVQFQATAK